MTATEEKWFGRVTEWRESGLSATEFARGREFAAGSLRHWAYLLKKRKTSASGAGSMLVRLARVEREPAVAAAAALTVEVGGACLRVPSGFDEATVRAAIGALLEGVARGSR